MKTDYEAVIGLEVHVQLKTRSKMFARAPYQYGAQANSLTDPVVMGLPGTLPVPNKEAVYKTVQIGLMFGSQIAESSHWDRKNYFYPDLPKNYQISQNDAPLCVGGQVEIELPGPSRNIQGEHKTIRLNRVHLEEDAGKLTHAGAESWVDYNRAGCPLAEIVTEPDLHTPEEVFAYLTALRTHLVYADISECDMEKGQLRCDANISIRPRGSNALNTKVELKNLNSITGVRNGVAYEIARQIQVIEQGGTIRQETHRWDAAKGVSLPMRTKETANDYRYFPDPDLVPITLSVELKKELQSKLPELPWDKQRRFQKDYGLPYTLTSVLCPSRELSDYFEAAHARHPNPKGIANLITNDLLRELSNAGSNGSLPLSACNVSPEALADLVKLVDAGTLSKQLAQTVFLKMFQTGQSAEAIVEAEGLKQDTDTDALKALCKDVIDANPTPVEQYRAGKANALNALKGQVMKATQGRAHPKLVGEVLEALLS